ncbi:hypothetical protein L209DRAFT_683531 [Thermothelomyces heterothallicus CBS 203.75]
MASPGANNSGSGPAPDAHFSPDATMPSPRDAVAHQDAYYSSSFWSHQNVSFPSPSATDGFGAAQRQHPLTDATLPPQAEHNEQRKHLQARAQHPASASSTTGPPYVCGIEGCTRSYPRHGELEYVSLHRRSPPPFPVNGDKKKLTWSCSFPR